MSLRPWYKVVPIGTVPGATDWPAGSNDKLGLRMCAGELTYRWDTLYSASVVRVWRGGKISSCPTGRRKAVRPTIDRLSVASNAPWLPQAVPEQQVLG
jgi:hypothetical protein